MRKGVFISFEGGEGCGKDTQIILFKDYLEKKGYNVVVSREPGGVLISEEIRKLILDPKYEKNTITELLLFEAARSEYVNRVIKPAIEDGKIFISNRFYDSSTVYQGYAGGIDVKIINQLNKLVTKSFVPDLTFYLNVSPSIGLERARKSKSEFEKGDFMEKKDLKFHTNVWEGFKELARLNPKRIKTINAFNSIKEVNQEIIYCFNDFIDEFS